jgi:hypothetical protein
MADVSAGATIKRSANWRRHRTILGAAAIAIAWLVFEEKTSPGSWIKLDFSDLILELGAAYAVLSTAAVRFLRVSSWVGIIVTHAASFAAVVGGVILVAG